MINSQDYILNNSYFQPYNKSQVNFRAENSAPLSKPIETVQKSIEGSVDTFVKKVDKEKNKKSTKTAVAVGSSVLVLSGLVAILNPKYSSKMLAKLKQWSSNAGSKVQKHKDDVVKSKFYKACETVANKAYGGLQFTNNINSAKDLWFKSLCKDQKDFVGIKDKSIRQFVNKLANGFVKVMSRVHDAITNAFDSIGKHTVKGKYKGANKKLDSLENLINQYKSKLPADKKALVEAKLAEIKTSRTYFTQEEIMKRLDAQEGLMSNLERDVNLKIRAYKNGFIDRQTNNIEHIDKNLTFWAEDVLMPQRNKLEKAGNSYVQKLIGETAQDKGAYNEIYNIMAPNLSIEEKTIMEKSLRKAGKKLHKANKAECVDYFDKKRDLILGGAPTDMVTAAGSLGLCGLAISTADSKDDKISRALTGGFPIIAGLGASLAFTAMLFSGVQGMLLGALTSIGLSKIGHIADNYIIGNKPFHKEVKHA